MSQTNQPISINAAFEDYVLDANRIVSVLSDSAIFAEHGIGLAEWAVLRAVSQAEGGSVGNLALIRQVGISRQRLRDLLRSLEERKLVQVAVSDADRRQRDISLGDAAPEVLEAISVALGKLSGSLGFVRQELATRSLAASARLAKAVIRAQRKPLEAA